MACVWILYAIDNTSMPCIRDLEFYLPMVKASSLNVAQSSNKQSLSSLLGQGNGSFFFLIKLEGPKPLHEIY